MSKKIFAIVFLTLFALILIGCKKEEETAQPELANPASVYCQGLGYTEETRESEVGQYGVCIFPDGAECDSWAFLGGSCGQEYSYCLQQGYTLHSSSGSSIATCVFDDSSTCNEYEYQQGQCKPGDNMP